MMLEKETINLLAKAVEKLEQGFDLPKHDRPLDYGKIGLILEKTAERLQNNYPYFHPLFAGQMIKPPHPIARAAYQLALWINPNNHALDGGRESSRMEKEVVADLAAMFGFRQHLGHLTGGGTMANMEALWVASKEQPGKYIVASDQAHYTHARVCEVLGIPFAKVASDHQGRMELPALKDLLEKEEVGTVVVTIGTTGLGMVDPLEEILALQKHYGFRIHADAAYGGYFRLANNLTAQAAANYRALKSVDSLVIDPHKHGLQPYGCGCVLFQNPAVARHYLHDSPYTYYTSDELHLGEISLECSRAGASAVALWATHQLLPPVENGEFAGDLSKCREAALTFANYLRSSEKFQLIAEPEFDIVVYAVKAGRTSEMTARADELFDLAARQNLHLSKFKWPSHKMEGDVIKDTEWVTCLRSCLLKPEHLDWVDEIWRILDSLD